MAEGTHPTRGSPSSEEIAVLARLAGFEFSPGRCELLAPQLEWLAAEAARIDAIKLADEEPASIFRPGALTVAKELARRE